MSRRCAQMSATRPPTWVAEALPPDLAQALGPYMSPGDRGGATLLARIDNIYLGPSSGGTGPAGASQDTINGALIVTGPRGRVAAETPLRAISSITRRPSIRLSSNGPITIE